MLVSFRKFNITCVPYQTLFQLEFKAMRKLVNQISKLWNGLKPRLKNYGRLFIFSLWLFTILVIY